MLGAVTIQPKTTILTCFDLWQWINIPKDIFHHFFSSHAVKKEPVLLFRVFFGDEILPSYVGIIFDKPCTKDPYELNQPVIFMESLRPVFFFVGSTFFCWWFWTFVRVGYPGVQSNWDNSFFVVSRRPRDTSYGHTETHDVASHDSPWIMPRLGGETSVEKKVPNTCQKMFCPHQDPTFKLFGNPWGRLF